MSSSPPRSKNKRALSPDLQPVTKRSKIILASSAYDRHLRDDFISLFSDELVLHIFQYLTHDELNTCSRVSKRWYRLANDRHLWKMLFLSRFRIPKGDYKIMRNEISRDLEDTENTTSKSEKKGRDWKFIYRVSHNWETGNCKFSILKKPSFQLHTEQSTTHSPIVQFTKEYIITSATPNASSMTFWHRDKSANDYTVLHTLLSSNLSSTTITILCLDKAPSSSRLAAGHSNGAFSIWDISIPSSPHELASNFPPQITFPILALSLHSPYLVTCSSDFVLSIYHITPSSSASSRATTILLHQLRSYVCRAPITLDLAPTITDHTWTVTIMYPIPLYASTWSLGLQQIVFSSSTLLSTHHTAASRAPELFAPPTSIAFEPPYVVTGHANNTIQLYCVSTETELELIHLETLTEHTSGVGAIALRNGRLIVGDRGGVAVWDIQRQKKKVYEDDKNEGVEARVVTVLKNESKGMGWLGFDEGKVVGVSEGFVKVWSFCED